MVWATFGRGDAALQKVAVQVLGQIDDASASRSLVLLAVFSGSAGGAGRGGGDIAAQGRAGVRRDADRDDPRADRVPGEEGAAGRVRAASS